MFLYNKLGGIKQLKIANLVILFNNRLVPPIENVTKSLKSTAKLLRQRV